MGRKGISVLQNEHLEWATRNFGPRNPEDPLLGLIEEVGEAAHAVLKRKQGIRGSVSDNDAKLKDAVGDVAIYLMDLCNATGVNMELMCEEAKEYPRRAYSDFDAILKLSVAVGNHSARVIDDGPGCERMYDVRNILYALNDLCAYRGWDFLGIVNDTWEEVSKRNWKESPIDGAVRS